MKPKKLLTVFGVLCAIGEMLEYLAIPALFVVVGILNALPWQYYAIFIGGYFALLLIGELAIRLIFRALGKKYASRFAKKVEKLRVRFCADKENPANLPAEDN